MIQGVKNKWSGWWWQELLSTVINTAKLGGNIRQVSSKENRYFGLLGEV